LNSLVYTDNKMRNMLGVLRERAVVIIRGGSFGTRDSEVYVEKGLILYGG
jgi:hypothetical protein